MFVDVREPHTNKLLFRYDPERDLVEIQERKVKTVVDLTQYKVDSALRQYGRTLGERIAIEEDRAMMQAPESAKESDSERRTDTHSSLSRQRVHGSDGDNLRGDTLAER